MNAYDDIIPFMNYIVLFSLFNLGYAIENSDLFVCISCLISLLVYLLLIIIHLQCYYPSILPNAIFVEYSTHFETFIVIFNVIILFSHIYVFPKYMSSDDLVNNYPFFYNFANAIVTIASVFVKHINRNFKR